MLRQQLGTITSVDRIGVTPRFLVLTFRPNTTQGLQWVEVYKRPDPGDPTKDVLVERTRVVDRIPGIYPYYYILIHSEEDTVYVIDYLDSGHQSPLTPATRLTTVQYAPPTGIDREIYINGPVYTKELVSRDYTVLETMGERAILLRLRSFGLQCTCRQDESRHPNSNCLTCFGTGYDGGYDVFSPFLFDFQLAGERIQLTETAIVMDQQPRAWTVIAPELRSGDVVVRLHGQLMDRFEVTNPTRSVRDGVSAIPTIQEFQVRVHQQGHGVYRFPVEKFVTDYTQPTSHSGMPEKGI